MRDRQSTESRRLALKRKLLFCTLAAAAALMPMATQGQVASPGAPAEPTEREFKYEVFAGYAYTSINQVNQSRSGLQGVEISVQRDWGKHFGVMGDGSWYRYPIESGNVGTPSVEEVLFGPTLHAELFGHYSAFVRALLGGAHTAGESEIPNISFAGGAGGGMEYRLKPRISLRASGDEIYSSFVADPEHLGYSPHRRGNGRAAFGVVYRF
jgi:hypothetical protein